MLSEADGIISDRHNTSHSEKNESFISENTAGSTESIKVYRRLNEAKKTGRSREEARLIPQLPIFTEGVA